jgi:hypothetical protein
MTYFSNLVSNSRTLARALSMSPSHLLTSLMSGSGLLISCSIFLPVPADVPHVSGELLAQLLVSAQGAGNYTGSKLPQRRTTDQRQRTKNQRQSAKQF